MSVIANIAESRPEAKLPEMDDHFRSFIAQAPVAIAILDCELRYVAASRRWSIDHGLDIRELRGLPYFEVLPDPSDHWRPLYRRGLAGETLSSTASRFARPDGTVQWLRWEIRPWLNQNTQTGIILCTEDITGYKQSETLFQAMIEAAPVGMVMSNAAGDITVINATVEKLFGYARNELLGKKVDTLVPQQSRSKHQEHRARYVADPHARPMGSGRDLYGLRKDGSEFPVEVGLSPVRTDAGLFILATVADITQRRQQAEALRRSNEKLTASNVELQRCAYIASHDLQSPLRSICGFVQALQSEYQNRLDERANDWIRRTVRSAEHLQALIHDLVAYSHVDQQHQSFEPVALHDVFDDAIVLLDASIREAGAHITCSELPTVMGVRSQLVQLLANLIGNGIKYHDALPPRVRIFATENDHEWVISVRDNGIGIDPKYHEHVFEVFHRLHGQHKYPGTGIGLAICRRVIERHGGHIWVESAPGHGSTFHFTIPKDATKYHDQ